MAALPVILSREAAEQLDAQLRYLRSKGANQAANEFGRRVMQFLTRHLAEFPRSGRHLADRDLWETWIPRTRLILWYRIEPDHVAVATVWHSAQDLALRARPA